VIERLEVLDNKEPPQLDTFGLPQVKKLAVTINLVHIQTH
jgi:hypothetical protein